MRDLTEAQETVVEGPITEPQYLVYIELDQPYYWSTREAVTVLDQDWTPGGVQVRRVSSSRAELRVENDDWRHTQNAVSGVYQRGTVQIYWAYPGSGFENLLEWSEAFDNTDAWSVTGGTVTANTAIAPDGSLSADTLEVTSDGSFQGRVAQSETIGIDAYVISTHAKANASGIVAFTFEQNSPLSGVRCWFDLNSGTTGSVTSYGDFTDPETEIEDKGDGWYRCTAYVFSTSEGGFQFYIWPPDSDGSSGATTGNSVYIWGAQLEQGDTLTAYKKTESAAYNDPELLFEGLIYACPQIGWWIDIDAQRTPPRLYPHKKIRPPFANHLPAAGYMVTFDGATLRIENE